MKKRYVVRLSTEERERLEGLVNRGREAAYRRRHAQVLLLADEGEHGESLIDREVAERVGCTRRTVEQIRERCVCEGLQAALERKKRSRERTRVLDGEGEARLVSLACSEPPELKRRSRTRPARPCPFSFVSTGARSPGVASVNCSRRTYAMSRPGST